MSSVCPQSSLSPGNGQGNGVVFLGGSYHIPGRVWSPWSYHLEDFGGRVLGLGVSVIISLKIYPYIYQICDKIESLYLLSISELDDLCLF